ncbi:hypothetical protein HD806DRAFT_522960 [Xylariaceae sp. AK1471]|nr:hypothetical protein HD806DRAFT_522960 [Xylariaceae sp. AK1471]
MDGLTNILERKESNSLEDYLERHISAKDRRLFAGFGVSVCDDDYKWTPSTDNSDSLWTLIALSVDGKVNEREARYIMRKVDLEIDEELPPELKPRRVAYRLLDDSNTVYHAKSRRVQGELPAGEGQARFIYEDDFDPTPPASPRGEAAKVKVVEVDLESLQC